jgi:hypothetical protein
MSKIASNIASDMAAVSKPKRSKTLIWLFVALALVFLAAANFHLLYVATTSQPDCVAHVGQGEGSAERKLFSAAQSSCSPR